MSISLHVSNVWRSNCIYVATATLRPASNWASLATWRCAVGQKPTSPLRAICCPFVTRSPTSTTAAWHGIDVANPSGPFSNKATHRFEELLPHFGWDLNFWSLACILIPEDDTTLVNRNTLQERTCALFFQRTKFSSPQTSTGFEDSF